MSNPGGGGGGGGSYSSLVTAQENVSSVYPAFALAPTPDSVTFQLAKDGPVHIYVLAQATGPGAGVTAYLALFLDGVEMTDDTGANLEMAFTNGAQTCLTLANNGTKTTLVNLNNAGNAGALGIPLTRWLAAGTHTISLRWAFANGSNGPMKPGPARKLIVVTP